MASYLLKVRNRLSILSLLLHIYPACQHFLSILSCAQAVVNSKAFSSTFSRKERNRFLRLFTFTTGGRELFLTFAGETEATESVTILVLSFFPRWHLRRVRHIQEGVALPLMRMVHALSPSAPSSPDPRTDVILSQSRFTTAMG